MMSLDGELLSSNARDGTAAHLAHGLFDKGQCMNNEITSDQPAAADDTARLVRTVRVERLADGDAALERELDDALELWLRELSKLLRG